MADRFQISYDRFIRTVDTDHYAASQAIWQAMVEAGDLYLDRYEGWYSVRDEAFYDEKELVEGEGGAKLSPQGTRSNGRRRRPGSSACPSTSSLCSISTPPIPTSSGPRAGATR